MRFSAADHEFLTGMGVAAECGDPAPRSEFPSELVLQAADDQEILAPDRDQAEGLPVYVDGRPATDPETRAFAALVLTGSICWRGTEVSLTSKGRSILDRWSRYRPLHGGEQA